MVHTRQFPSVVVNPATSSAVLTAGCTWRDVIDAAAHHGLVAIHAFDQSRGAVDSVLSNDFGPYSRFLGPSADSIRSSGSNTFPKESLEIDLFPMEGSFSGTTFWDPTAASAVVPLWMNWARTAPTPATTRLSVVTVRSHEPQASRAMLRLDGLVAVRRALDADASKAILDDLLNPLREASNVISSRWLPTTNPLRQVDPESKGERYWSRREHLEQLSPDDALGLVDESVGSGQGFELNQLGGQMSVGRLSGRPGTHPSARFELIRAARDTSR